VTILGRSLGALAALVRAFEAEVSTNKCRITSLRALNAARAVLLDCGAGDGPSYCPTCGADLADDGTCAGCQV
jgi:hypothetical protein